MSQPTALPLLILGSAIKKRRSVGLNKVIRIARVLTLDLSELTRCSTHCAAIRGSKRLRKRLFQCANSARLRNEDRQFLHRAEAAQCYSRSGSLPGRCMATHPGREHCAPGV